MNCTAARMRMAEDKNKPIEQIMFENGICLKCKDFNGFDGCCMRQERCPYD